jgi:hypothetical protein
MKKSIYFIAILIILFGYSACHYDYIPVPKSTTGIRFEGHIIYGNWNPASLTASEEAYRFISLSGSGYSNILEMGSFTMENSHVSIYKKSEALIYINRGKFKLSGAGKISIYGIYEGTGSFKNNRFLSELEFTILGGDVTFKGASGNFTGRLTTSPEDPEKLQLDINGLIMGIDGSE